MKINYCPHCKEDTEQLYTVCRKCLKVVKGEKEKPQ